MATKGDIAAPKERASLDVRTLLAFFAIYVVWGTTFLAIRVAVAEVPPLFAAGTRFFTAGMVLYATMRLRGESRPSGREWRSLAMMGSLMFVLEYGPLFWAEKFVPSGVAAVLLATLPLDTLLLEMLVFRQQRFRWPPLLATLLGFAGVVVLLLPHGGQQVPLLPCLAILAGAASWSTGSVLSRSLPLPHSKALTAGATMMLGGGVLLAISGVAGELRPWPHVSLRAGAALLYLIVFGSLVGFTAFVWLLARMPATRVASHAYVNPVVAVALGYFVAGEQISGRMLVGAAVIVMSVFLILRLRNEDAKPKAST